MKKLMTGMLTATLAGACAMQAAESKSWTDTVKMKGDVRYRYERIDDEKKDDVRERDRIRARLGAEAKPQDNLKLVIGLATGGDDPVSGNQTLGEGLTKKAFNLDQAYFDWTGMQALTLRAGRMANPFVQVRDLIWDSDLSPEGMALLFEKGNDRVRLTANAGSIWVQERSGENDDTMLYGGQGAVRIALAEGVYMNLGGGLFSYDNMEGYAPIDYEDSGKFFGNSSQSVVDGGVTSKVYATEYELVEGFAELVCWVGMPLSFYGNYVVNTEADADDTGYMLGVSLGKAKNPGTYELEYNYRELEKDAVVGAYTDSDSWGGGTDGKGHKLGAKYQVTPAVQLAASYFMDEKTLDKSTDYDRLQLDLIAKF